MYAFGLPDRLLRGFYMAFVCFVCVCDVHHVDKRVWICFYVYQGRGMAKGTPSPFQGRATVRLPPSNFFLFFQANFFIFFYPTP